MYLNSSRESYSCDCPRKTFQHKRQYIFQLPYFDNLVIENISSEQNKLNKKAWLKMHFMSQVFFNTMSLMTSVCML